MVGDNANGGAFIPETVQGRHYDAIIIGGGTAGLVAAARLSEDASRSILVIEAGADRRGDPRIDTPGAFMGLWGDKDYDWDFYSESQSQLNGRQIPQTRGKVLGGSSAINVTAVVYPTQRNFEAWTKLGNDGWSHEDMAPYYRKFHTFHPASQYTNEQMGLDKYMRLENQGTHGPISATYGDVYGPYNQAWMDAFEGTGFDDHSDPILGRKMGPFMPPNSLDPGTMTRSYAASGYYTTEIESRPNLDVLTETYVHKILFEDSDDDVIAKGVEASGPQGNVFEIYANEIILAAGAVQSPQVLEISGIGSKAILEQNGIEVLIDNPGVGENLQDHCFSTVSFEVADGQITADVMRDPAVVEALAKLYRETKTGPMSGVPFSLAYVPPVDFNGRMQPEDVRALTHTQFGPRGQQLDAGRSAQYAELRAMMLDPNESTCFYGFAPGQMHVDPSGKTSMKEAYKPKLPENYISIMVGLNHPFSRGSVHIGSSDPRSPPIIDPKYLSHQLDLEILARGTQFIERIVEHPAMKPLLKTEIRLPRNANLEDLESAKKITKDRLWTTYHLSCSCPMMPRKLGGVVDDRLKVYGTRNVRIVDASIFPMITLGNIQATVYAVAERACDLIKQDWESGLNGVAHPVNGIH